jgi:hypothetical protein
MRTYTLITTKKFIMAAKITPQAQIHRSKKIQILTHYKGMKRQKVLVDMIGRLLLILQNEVKSEHLLVQFHKLKIL